MNGLIIVNQEIGHNAYKIRRFEEEFSKMGVSLSTFINDGTLAVVDADKIRINLPKADFVLYLDKDIYLARELEKAGYRLFNKADFIKLCDDKMLTQIGCANLGIKMPKTIAGPLIYTKLQSNSLAFLKQIEKEFGYPLVLKKVYGSLGEGVFLVNNYEELESLYKKLYREPLLFQEYVSSSFGKSMRVLIIDGKVVDGFIRYNTKDFRSNFGDSATGKLNVGHKNFLDLAQDIADKLNIEYAGIDFLFGKDDEPILCEINSNAFFEEFEKITSINVAKLFAEMVVRKIK